MLYGHIETHAQRVDHLRRLRELQDETGGFTGFVPFAFEPEGARPGLLKNIRHATGFEELKNLAVSRIYLDNFDHITAYWVSLGLALAQQALNYGVDDLHGTIREEKIFHMAGATTPQQQSCAALEKAIREAGSSAQRDTLVSALITPKSPVANTQPHEQSHPEDPLSRDFVSDSRGTAHRLREVSQFQAAHPRIPGAGGIRASLRSWRATWRPASWMWRWRQFSKR